VAILRARGPLTVRDLAFVVGLSQNAVRVHLAALENDNIVRQGATQAGFRKPSQTYEITEEAEHSYSRAYPGVLEMLVRLLEDKLPEEELNGLFVEVGRNLAPRHAEVAFGSIRERVDNAVNKLNALGGSGRVLEEEGQIVIRTNGCPLRGLTSGHPNACRIAASMLDKLVGANVADRCEHGSEPKCCFVVSEE